MKPQYIRTIIQAVNEILRPVDKLDFIFDEA